ncbi:hypothetical protein HYFRA_00004847 [Hymenoscyphus fraxineus]|uniref:Uncharacterized protein n=1 Tax=Hymenoscyphus fraxineus TaxID=746836 RepID=A0A9N9PMZ8_9HELO|nr:hypothetical protein HYFRA_00004847 [Hymenoscyphus fraxineus]
MMSSSTNTNAANTEPDQTFLDPVKEYHKAMFRKTADQMQKALLAMHREGKLHHLDGMPAEAMPNIQQVMEKPEGFFEDSKNEKEGDGREGVDDA